MRARDDDVLLAALGRALEVPDAEPSGAEVAALHQAVSAGGASDAMARQRRARRRGWVAGLVGGAVLGLTGTAAAVNSSAVPVPDPVRDVAHSIGLPVDSRQLDDAKDALEDLREDLEDRDRRKVSESATELRLLLAALTDDERRSIEADANAALAQADALLAPGVVVPTPTTTPAAPAAPQTATTVAPPREDNSGPGGGGDRVEEPDEDRSGSGGDGDRDEDDDDRSGSNSGRG